MKKRILISLFVCLLFSATTVSSQTVTAEIKTTIYCSHCTQCETCGLKFEQELYKLKGVKSFTVVAESNIIKVSYNPKKIMLDKIRQCIASCGYDADEVKATEAGLNSLDGCCKKQE